MQWDNGFSGFQPVDGLLLSIYNIVLVTIYLTYISVYDKDVKYSLKKEDENLLPYKMSEFYAFSRSQQTKKGFLTRIFSMNLYAIVTALVIHFIYTFSFGSGMLGHDGK